MKKQSILRSCWKFLFSLSNKLDKNELWKHYSWCFRIQRTVTSNIDIFQNSFLEPFIEEFKQQLPTYDKTFQILNEGGFGQCLKMSGQWSDFWVGYIKWSVTVKKASHMHSAATARKSWWSRWSEPAGRHLPVGCSLVGGEGACPPRVISSLSFLFWSFPQNWNSTS